MPVTLDQLRAVAPTLADMEAEADLPEVMRFTDVKEGAEFMRIVGLARRAIPSQDDPEAIELAEMLTNRLAKTPTPYPGRLRAIQGLALKECWENRGGVGMIRVGGGKTLIDFLLPEILQTARPLIITKAMMIPDMEAERRKLAKDWHIRSAHQCPIVSFEKLAAPSSGEKLDDDGKVIIKSLLSRLAPTLIIIDEAHSWADSGSVGAKRMKAFLEDNPDCIVWAQTGTFFKTSIKDASHIFQWCLRDRAPLPYDFKERETWASHLDARSPGKGGVHAGVGALLTLLDAATKTLYDLSDYDEQLAIIRRAVARRILETPGVIGTQDPPLDIGLEIDHIVPADDDEDIEELFKILAGDPSDPENYPGWRLPDGTEIPDGIVMARHRGTSGYGHWNVQMYQTEIATCLARLLKTAELTTEPGVKILEDRLTLGPYEHEILKRCEKQTGLAIELAQAASALKYEGSDSTKATSKTSTGYPSNSTNPSLRSAEGDARYAQSSPSRTSREGGSCTSTTATKPGRYEACFVDPATGQSVSSETLTRRYPGLAGILAAAYNEALPSESWRRARNQWAKWCRKAIRYNKKGIDSESRMKDAARRELVNDKWTLAECTQLKLLGLPQPEVGSSRLDNWEAEEKAERKRTGLLEPPSVAVWVSEQIVDECERWLAKAGNGVIWVNSIGLGELLSERLSIPYYGAGGLDARGRHIKEHPGGPGIASLKANGTGRNLQGFWHNNLWLCTPNEQALGRTHRAGQLAKVVRNWVYLGCQDHLKSFHAARSTKAAFAEDMQLSPQKLRYAQTNMPQASELGQRGGYRWKQPKKTED